jgi:hypothetical protein
MWLGFLFNLKEKWKSTFWSAHWGSCGEGLAWDCLSGKILQLWRTCKDKCIDSKTKCTRKEIFANCWLTVHSTSTRRITFGISSIERFCFCLSIDSRDWARSMQCIYLILKLILKLETKLETSCMFISEPQNSASECNILIYIKCICMKSIERAVSN